MTDGAAGRRGFTLVELLTVIGICGLLLAFSFPTLSRYKQNLLLNASAFERASELRAAQARALGGGQAVQSGRFKFSRTGAALPGESGTEIFAGRRGLSKKVIVSSAGRVRIEGQN